MKNYFIIISFFLLITQVYAQKTASITGKIENCYFDDGALRKEWYNTQTMSIEEEIIDFEISEDSSFNIQLKDLNEGFTRYWLRLGKEYTHLYLAQGDSIYVTVDANRFSESIIFTGKGAGRNNYRKEVYKMFMNQDIENKYLWKGGPDSFFQNLKAYVDKKMMLLNKYLNSGEIDSVYYQFENERIEIYSAAKIVRHLIRHKVYDQGNTSNEFKLVVKYAEYNNSKYLQEIDFREIVKNYPDYKLKFSSGEYKTSVSEKINFAKNKYKGLVLSYYYHKLIYTCVSNAASPVERNIILDFLTKNIDDPLSNKLIDKLKQLEPGYQTSNGDIFAAALGASILVVSLLLLLLLLSKISSYLGQTNFKFNTGLLFRNLIYLIAVVIASVYLQRFHLVGVATLLLWLSGFIVHNYVAIPKFVIRKKFHYYLASITLLIVLFVAGMHMLDIVYYKMRIIYFKESILRNTLPYIFFGFILITISWTVYYLNILAKEKTTVKNLVKDNRINPEVVFNIFLVLISYMILLVNQTPGNSIYQALPFFTAIILFYLQTFYIIPKYLNKNKLYRFISINVLILLVIAAGMIIVNALQSYFSIKRIGIDVSIFDVISINKSINFEKLVASIFIIVPAFIYNYIKRQLQNQETTGYKLFRKKEAELEQLRSQVNPHFLFNTLNTLYAFALKEKSDKTAECIAKLASLMRFMIDDMSKDFIPLKNEIGYILDYIKLQSIRSSVEHDIKLNIDVEEDKIYQIAPMLLIPFVENAFKHGINPNELSHLKIDIKAKDNQIQIVIENSIDINFEAYYKEKGFGIGIENVRKRLGHIYPGRHNISVAKTVDRFIVIVKIEIKNDL
jgi:sensor histidine kinase YesM